MAAELNNPTADIERTMVGGAQVARLDLEQTARLIVTLAQGADSRRRPYYLTSVNGEVLARRRLDAAFAGLIDDADLISADGEPLVFASRILAQNGLPERVATTDLYPVVAAMAEEAGLSFYLLGATEEVNSDAYGATRRMFPRLNIRGRSHGFLRGDALDAKLAEINALAPDILWLALGVPLEQEFVARYSARLPNVKVIKTFGRPVRLHRGREVARSSMAAKGGVRMGLPALPGASAARHSLSHDKSNRSHDVADANEVTTAAEPA